MLLLTILAYEVIVIGLLISMNRKLGGLNDKVRVVRDAIQKVPR